MSATTTRRENTQAKFHGETIPVLFVSDLDSEEYGAYLPVPVYYDAEGNEHTLQVGDVIRVQFASEEAFGFSSYEEVQVVKFNKASINVRRLQGRAAHWSGTTVNKRVNFSKIAEGESQGYSGMYQVSATVYFVRTAAEQKALVSEKNAAAEVARAEQHRVSRAKTLAFTPYARENALEEAERAAQAEATQAILAKYEVEIKILAAKKFLPKTEAIAAEFPVVEGVYVVTVGDGTGWGRPDSYAFTTEDEALAFADDHEGSYVTLSGPIDL